MRDLIKQEQFELEVLEKLNSGRFLDYLVFGGGTMLRLCYGLNRFSVDLDFWILKDIDIESFFERLNKYLSELYTLKDAMNKHFSLLFEIKSANFPRSLKVEIRKKKSKIATEQAIAYSKYSNKQVFLRVVSLKEMMSSKAEAFLRRKEIRDVFDMEFLLRRGMQPDFSVDTAGRIIKMIDSLSAKDYSVKLGSLLEEDQRNYYKSANFRLLKLALNEITRKTNMDNS